MARAAFLLIRILALYLATQVFLGTARSLPFVTLQWDDLLRVLLPYGSMAVIAILLWFFADTLAVKIGGDADLWLLDTEINETEDADENTDEEEGRELSLSRATVGDLLSAALVVVGILLSAYGIMGIVGTLLEAALWDGTFGVPLFGQTRELFETPPFIDRLRIPQLVVESLQVTIGLWLLFGSRSIARPLLGIRDWYAMDPLDDDEDEDGPAERITTDL